MISNNSGKDKSSQPQQSPEVAAGGGVKALDPNTPIEVASTGTGTINDSSGKDTRPPGVCDLDLLA
jgi:hypothetical protein